MARDAGAGLPIALHLDHGDSFELAKSCIDSGFSSVMLDGSHHPFDENAELTKRVVDYAHEREVTVEGELGVLAGVEDEVSHEFPITPNRRKSKNLLPEPAWTVWPFPSAPHTGPISSKSNPEKK